VNSPAATRIHRLRDDDGSEYHAVEGQGQLRATSSTSEAVFRLDPPFGRSSGS